MRDLDEIRADLALIPAAGEAIPRYSWREWVRLAQRLAGDVKALLAEREGGR